MFSLQLTYTTNETACSKSCKTIFKAAGWTLPVVSASIAGIRMAPGLQALIVDVLRGAFAQTGSNQTTAFVFVDHVRMR
jgi:hypothetical protein